jgi:hypothetical protein
VIGQLRPEDVELLKQLIELRDSAVLAGITDDVFQVIEVNGGRHILVAPGRNKGPEVPSSSITRLRRSGALDVVKDAPHGFTFDLVVDIRDRLEAFEEALGRPTRSSEAEARREEAERRLRELESIHADQAANRLNLVEAAAGRISRRIRIAASVVLLVLYLALVTVGGYFVSGSLPIAVVAAVVVVAVVIQAADWALGVDGFAAAAYLERKVRFRILNWLTRFAEPIDRH